MLFLFYIAFFATAHMTRLSYLENLRVKETCGKTYLNERVSDLRFKSFGARRVLENEYPWLMTLTYDDGDYETKCSGALISPRHVLTAAHCIADGWRYSSQNKYQCGIDKKQRVFERDYNDKTKLWHVYLGEKCSSAKRCSKRRTVAKLMFHPSFDDCDFSDDIAVFELDEDIPETEASSICMPLKRTKLRNTLNAAGAGSDIARLAYTKHRGGEPRHTYFSNGIQVITVTLKKESDPFNTISTFSKNSSLCEGDSGGPLFQYNKRGNIVIVGVASTIYPDCHIESETWTNYFEDVRPHIDWICSQTALAMIILQREFTSEISLSNCCLYLLFFNEVMFLRILIRI